MKFYPHFDSFASRIYKVMIRVSKLQTCSIFIQILTLFNRLKFIHQLQESLNTATSRQNLYLAFRNGINNHNWI